MLVFRLLSLIGICAHVAIVAVEHAYSLIIESPTVVVAKYLLLLLLVGCWAVADCHVLGWLAESAVDNCAGNALHAAGTVGDEFSIVSRGRERGSSWCSLDGS